MGIFSYFSVQMKKIMKAKAAKKKGYSGRNIRISDTVFNKVKSFVDERGLRLGRFAEMAFLEKLEKEKK